MATISTVITQIRYDVEDPTGTRWSDATILNFIKVGIRRMNRIVQRNRLKFGQMNETGTFTASQAYFNMPDDFDIFEFLFRTDLQKEIKLFEDREWEGLKSTDVLQGCNLDYANSRISLRGTPGSAIPYSLYYFPTIDPSDYTTSSSMPWSSRLDDQIAEYVGFRLKNIDEMDVSMETQLLADLETQILQAYDPNQSQYVEDSGWVDCEE
jgi:hypothetical protein